MNKDVVAGLGEIGLPILILISRKENAVGGIILSASHNPGETKFKKFESLPTRFLHITIPVNENFNSNVIQLYKKFEPKCIVIHSTISPGTTEQLQKKLKVAVEF